MPVGRINWFGGINTKKNKPNNYGFIKLIKDNAEEDIFVTRTDVSKDLQSIIEGTQGEGVYVEFEIIEDKQGKKRAVNLQLLKLLGVVEWFKEGRGYAKCENRPDIRICSENFINNQEKNINSDDILLFAIRYNSRYHKDEGFLIKQIDHNTQEKEIINRCFHSSIPAIFTPFISKYFDYIQLSTSDKIKTIEDKINLVNNDKEKSLIVKEICTKHTDVYLNSLLIRNLLNIDDYLLLLEDYFNDYGEEPSFYHDFMDRIYNTSHISLEVVEKINNHHIIHTIVFMGNFNIFKLFLIKYLKHIPDENAINFVLEKLITLDNINERKELLNQLIDQFSSIFLLSSDLRKWLMSENCDIHKYCQFINEAVKSISDDELRKKLLIEIFEYIKQSDENKRIILWDEIPEFAQYLEYRNPLWNFAPKKYQQQIIKRKFEKFFQLQEQFANSFYPYERYITANITDLFPLDDNSKILIEKWDNEVKNNIHKAAQMISARGAEKLVINYYQNIGYQVEDVSIHQVTNQSQDWKQGDIRIDSQTLLDVKNARTNINSHVYSEFCVPSFKNDRGENVKIIAVLSPYLQKKYLIEYNSKNNPYKIEKISQFKIKITHQDQELNQRYSETQKYESYLRRKKEYSFSFEVFAPTILGTFQKSELIKLENYFSDRLISVNMKRDNINNYLPPWLFDYEEDFYCEQIKSIKEFKNLSPNDIPSGEDIEILEKECGNFIALFICSKSELPQTWLQKIPKWEVDFINYLIELPTNRITLPYIFLSILVHFFQMLCEETEKYQPIEYLRILGGFSSEKFAQIKSKLRSSMNLSDRFIDSDRLNQIIGIHPLKIYDPLNTIQSFCDSLQSIWDNREKVRLNEFKIFKFNGQGLLTAQRFEGESPTTLLAYCGGWIEGKGKCGYKPLVIGKHENCHVCGRLICPKDGCQYCSERCSGYHQRKKKNESNNRDNMDNFPF